MATQTERIPVSHIGSLVRPPALIEFLEKQQRNEAWDRDAYDACLTESVAEAVRLQAEAGMDIVSDGEYGKSINWAFYIHNRLSGIERQAMSPEEAADPMSYAIGGRDREAFPEFYGEYDRQVLSNATGAYPARGDRTDRILRPDRAAAGHRQPEGRVAAVGNVEGFLPVVAPASALPNARNEHYDDEESFLFALADALHEEYRAIIDAGLHLQVDDAFLPYMHERLVPPMTLAEYRDWGGAAHRGAEPCPPGSAASTHALPHLLGQLERPAPVRRADEGHRRHRAQGECRRLCLRGGQPAPRTRMAGLEDGQAAGRAGA